MTRKELCKITEKETLSYTCLCQLFGNGDFARGRLLLETLGWLMIYARLEHPKFAEGIAEAVGVISAENREVNEALEKEGIFRTLEEIADEALTCFRALNREFQGGQTLAEFTPMLKLVRAKARAWAERSKAQNASRGTA